MSHMMISQDTMIYYMSSYAKYSDNGGIDYNESLLLNVSNMLYPSI